MKYVTIIDIARELGISKSTVSRALSGDIHNVKPETMQKIIDTAQRMGYQRNEQAVNLRRQHTKTVGIIIPDAMTPFFMTFIQHAQKELKKRGYQTIVTVANEDYEAEHEYLLMLAQSRVDGILMSVCHKNKNIEAYRQVMERGIPIVFFDRTVEDLDASQVRMDDEIMSFFMVETLIRMGKRHIIHLAGPSYVIPAVNRHIGYRQALEKFHLPYDERYVLEGGLKFHEGVQAMQNFLALGLEFDSVFCFTETTMVGAKNVLQNMHYRIPEDVAICTVSGTELCTFVHPTISAVEQPLKQMAIEASRLLTQQIENPDSPRENIVLRGDIVLRESTK